MLQEKSFLRTQRGLLQSKNEAKFIVYIVLPCVCISANAFTVPSVLPAIRNPEFSQMNVSESSTVLWLPDIWEGGEGCNVLEAVWIHLSPLESFCYF